jgi:hypothetical protein
MMTAKFVVRCHRPPGSTIHSAELYDVCLALLQRNDSLESVTTSNLPSWRDIEMAKEALSRVRVYGDRIGVEAVIPFTHLLIETDWDRVGLNAAALLQRRQLDYAEMRRLIQAV